MTALFELVYILVSPEAQNLLLESVLLKLHSYMEVSQRKSGHLVFDVLVLFEFGYRINLAGFLVVYQVNICASEKERTSY
jgi:hypothetical protein